MSRPRAILLGASISVVFGAVMGLLAAAAGGAWI